MLYEVIDDQNTQHAKEMVCATLGSWKGSSQVAQGWPLIRDPQPLKSWDYRGAAPTFGQEFTLVLPSDTLSYDSVLLSHSESS